MNKISKKIVALATMAAFVLTLVPAAAFAADGQGDGVPSANASKIVIDGGVEYAADFGETATVDFVINDKTGVGAGTAGLEKVKVWATDEKGNFTDAVSFTTTSSFQACQNPNFYKFNDGTQEVGVTNDTSFQVTFNRDGVYYIHAGVGDINSTGNTVAESLGDGFVQFNNSTPIKVTVNPADLTASVITLQGEHGGKALTLNATNKVATLDFNDSDYKGSFELNGTDDFTLTGTVRDKNNKIVPEEAITLSTDKTDVLQLTEKETVTDNLGQFKINFRMIEKNANIYIKIGDVTYTVRVLAANTSANDITVVEDGGYILAGTDEEHWSDEVNKVFSDAVKMAITDKYGDAVTEDLSETEPAANLDNTDHDNYLTVLARGDKSTLNSQDLILYWDGSNYTLRYVGGSNQKSDLTPGEYKVRVALLSKEYVDVTFTASEFGTVQDIVIDMKAKDTSDDNVAENWYSISDKVMLGQTVDVVAKYVDENGLKVKADNVQYGFNSDSKAIKDQNASIGRFWTQPDTVEHQVLLGSTITVSALDANNKKLVQETLTVVDSYDTYTLAFDPTEGPAGKDNVVNVSVVDEDNDVVKSVKGEISAFVVDQSNEDAVVTLAVDNKDVKNGKGEIVLYADKPTTVEVVVAVNDNGHTYASTLNYTIGNADVDADRTVVMTIGSTEYVVNNKIIKGDAAPYVDSAWRTMVPFRALGEAFGATVDWDQDNQSVIYTLGDTEIVMTIGEDTYTINGEEFNMDTAPVLSGDRTYVPVRFVAEGLGYTVTPLYDANNLTASVVFQR